MEIELTAPIAEVTVYPDRALIVRRGETTIDAPGEHILRVGGLPMTLLRASLRGTGRGPAGTRILSVEQSDQFNAQAPEATVHRLRADIERLDDAIALLDERATLLTDQRGWLNTLGEQTAQSLARSITRGASKPEDANALFTYTASEAQRMAGEQRQAQAERNALTREREARARELAQLSTRRPDRIAANVRLTLTTPGTVALQLTYVIPNASWRPRYDARVDIGGARVRLTQQALITQRTGEDWRGVDLSLSNAQPSTATALPDDPDPWYLDEAAPVQPMMAAMSAPAPYGAAMRAPRAHMMAAKAQSFSAGVSDEQFDATLLSANEEIDVVAVEVERSGVAQVFHLPGGVDVPSDGAPHTVGMGDDDLPCTLAYIAEPVVAPGAQLRAATTNATGHILLAGELHIFHATETMGEEYVGQTQLEQTAENAPLKLWLGADDNVTVKRELVERDTDKGALLQGDLRRVTLGYRVTLANRTATPQRVILKDRLPVPRHERIKLRTLDIRPQPSDRTKLEQLTWELTLNPGEERRVEWRFVVESPRSMTVVGLS